MGKVIKIKFVKSEQTPSYGRVFVKDSQTKELITHFGKKELDDVDFDKLRVKYGKVELPGKPETRRRLTSDDNIAKLVEDGYNINLFLE